MSFLVIVVRFLIIVIRFFVIDVRVWLEENEGFFGVFFEKNGWFGDVFVPEYVS